MDKLVSAPQWVVKNIDAEFLYGISVMDASRMFPVASVHRDYDLFTPSEELGWTAYIYGTSINQRFDSLSEAKDWAFAMVKFLRGF